MDVTKVIASSLACGLSAFGLASDHEVLSLPQAVSAAFTHRSSIQSQLERVSAAEASERAITPQSPVRLEFGYGTRPELGIGNDLLLAAPIDFFGKNAAERSVAHAEVLNARAELDRAAVELQTEVFSSYSELIAAQDGLTSAKVLADLAQQSYNVTKKRIDNGDLPPSQLLRSDLELRRAKQEVTSSELNLTSAKASFAGVLGVKLADVPTVDEVDLALPGVESIDKRPDVLGARAAVASASAERRVVRSATAPDFEIQLAHDYWDTSGQVALRAQFVWNFFDYGANAHKRSAASHTVKAAGLALNDTVAQANSQFIADQAAYHAALSEFQGSASLSIDAKSLLDKEEKAFTLGANTLLDVLDAVRSYRDILSSQTQARSRLVAAQGKLLASAGVLVGTLPKINKK